MGLSNPTHLIFIGIIAVVALVIFGPKKLPEIGRGVGSGIRDFRKGLSGEEDAPVQQIVEAPATPVVTTTTAAPAEAAAPVEAAAPAAEQAPAQADPAAPQS